MDAAVRWILFEEEVGAKRLGPPGPTILHKSRNEEVCAIVIHQKRDSSRKNRGNERQKESACSDRNDHMSRSVEGVDSFTDLVRQLTSPTPGRPQ